MANPWSEDVLYLPDPPFLFGGGSGYETTLHGACDSAIDTLKFAGSALQNDF